MCLLEGLAAGRAVVATRVGEVPQLIESGVTGLLVEPGDPGALAKAILDCIDDPEMAHELGRNGQASATQRHSSHAMADNYLAVYEKALDAPEPAAPSCKAGSLDISIIVACRNERRSIDEFLRSLLEQDMGGLTWEALIADGVSEDGTREILDAFSSAHKNIRILTNRGRMVSTGLNAAIHEARGKIILRFDAHTRYASDYCQRCVETLERTGAANVGGPARTHSKGAKARAIAAAFHSPFSTGGARFHQSDFEGFVDTVPYGCWHRETFERIGLFDETLVRNQDDEFNLRLLRAGGTIWQNPAIISWYSPRTTIRSLFLQYFQYGYWKVAVIQKHRLPGSWRHLAPASFVAANVLLPLIAGAMAIAGTKPMFVWACLAWLTFAGLYLLGNITASMIAARSYGIETLVYLPAVFAAFHFSYGLGFLTGIFHFAPHAPAKTPVNSMFAKVNH